MKNRVKQVSSQGPVQMQRDLKALQNKITPQASSVFEVLSGMNVNGTKTVTIPGSTNLGSAFNSTATNKSGPFNENKSTDYPFVTDFKPLPFT